MGVRGVEGGRRGEEEEEVSLCVAMLGAGRWRGVVLCSYVPPRRVSIYLLHAYKQWKRGRYLLQQFHHSFHFSPHTLIRFLFWGEEDGGVSRESERGEEEEEQRSASGPISRVLSSRHASRRRVGVGRSGCRLSVRFVPVWFSPLCGRRRAARPQDRVFRLRGGG